MNSKLLGRREPVEALESRVLFSVPAGFTQATVVSNIPYVAGMAVAPDGRVFVAQQKTGQIRVVKNDQLLSTPFATLPVRVAYETGLLGVALDPQFSTNGYLYAYWTTSAAPGVHNVVTRFKAAGDVAAANSRADLIHLPGPAQIHQGGMIGFGPDGKLYVPTGDVGQPYRAQSLDTVHGKVLRFNKDGTIPSDNPYYGVKTGMNRAIWASGLRNPFQFDFQPGTGRMHINDVGQDAWEEINLGGRGANYGWSGIEGPRGSRPAPAGYREPVYTYAHGGGDASITGGAFYAGGPFPDVYDNDYFFADYVHGWVKTLDAANPANTVATFGTGFDHPIDIKRSPDGGLWVLNHGDDATARGSLVRIRYAGGAQAQPPYVVAQPQPQTVPIGQPATFAVQAGGPGPLSYQGQMNGANIAGATAATYTRTAAAGDDEALFRVVVTNAGGSVTSAAARLDVVTNQYPTPAISAPATTFRYQAGQSVSFAGSATDPEDGAVPASRMTWSVVFHHGTHSHPFIDTIDGVASGTFVVPDVGETASDVWYRVHLTVRDAGGLARSTFRDVLPVKANVTLNATVGGVAAGGFALTLDGQPVRTSHAFVGVAGVKRAIGAPASQVVNGVTYDFAGWSNGGPATHTIATPAAAATYTAAYRRRAGTTAPPPAFLSGAAIGTPGSYANRGNTIHRALDGNLSTYFDGPASGGNWVGRDLGWARQVTQVRFAPRAGFAGRMVGGRFQASNSATFSSGVVDLHVVSAAPAGGTLTTVNVNPAGGSFRYVRYLAPANSYGNVAEVQFFDT